MGFDQLVPGNRSPTVNHLRLWSARALQPFHIEDFNAGNYPAAVEDQVEAKNLSRVLYPGRLHAAGQGAALQAAVLLRQREHPGHPRDASRRRAHARRSAERARRADERHASDARHSRAHAAADGSVRHALGAGLGDLPQRVRLHESHVAARGARNLAGAISSSSSCRGTSRSSIASTRNSCSRWRSASRAMARPRPRCRSSASRMGGACAWRTWRSSGLTRSTASRSCIRELMQKTIFSGFAQMFPDRFTNVTNGITVRRWLKQSNPRLSRAAHGAPGLAPGRTISRRSNGCAGRRTIRRSARCSATSSARTRWRWRRKIDRRTGIDVSVDSLFDVQVKRIHEYKRQLLNILYVITRYNRIKASACRELGAAHGDVRRQGGAGLRAGEGASSGSSITCRRPSTRIRRR